MNDPVRADIRLQVSHVTKVTGVTHIYGTTLALEDVSFQIQAGESLALIGPDGVGKVTLLGLLAGARKLQVGSVNVFDGSMSNTQHRNSVCTRIA